MSMSLEDIKVLEFATDVSGPWCGKLLGDFGADVIKIESPQGDPSRSYGPFPEKTPHPEKSASFLYLNTNKRGVTLDLNQPKGSLLFKKLVQWADILIDNHPPDFLEHFGFGWKSLVQINPGLIYTSITPYGRTGRRSHVKGGEVTLMHAGGIANLLPAETHDTSTPPVKPGGHPVGYRGGILAALATIAALLSQRQTGMGRMVDISLQDAVFNLISPFAALCRYNQFSWHRISDRPLAIGRMKTRDGYVLLHATEDHHFKKLREIMGNPEWFQGDFWLDKYYRTAHLFEIAPSVRQWMLNQTASDFFHQAAKSGIPVGPVNNAKEVLNDPQYRSRNFFVEVDHPAAGKYLYPGCPYKMSVSTPAIRCPAPTLGQHNDEVLTDQFLNHAGHNSPQPCINPTEKLPLKGVRVLDLGWVFAAPYATKLLADLGAEVIKIEGHTRTDILRRPIIWPLSDEAPTRLSLNEGMYFNSVNLNKKSLTIALGTPKGNALLKKMVGITDIVIDNMRPGVMEKLHMGYDELRKIKPDLINLRSSSRGLAGPQSQYLGYAAVHEGLAGVAYISGHPDHEPTQGAYTDVDMLNAHLATFVILTAYYHRTKSGEGQFIDLSQTESLSAIIGEELLGFQMTAKIPERKGNAHYLYAPHNVYRCWGADRWIALEIHSDEEFKILAQIINQPGLADNAGFNTMSARKRNEHELDSIISQYTRYKDRDWLVNIFCTAGLAAAPSRNCDDLFADQHLRDRRQIVKVQHPELGEIEVPGVPWLINNNSYPQTYAPLLGEHNECILKELLNLQDEEIENLYAEGIIGH